MGKLLEVYQATKYSVLYQEGNTSYGASDHPETFSNRDMLMNHLLKHTGYEDKGDGPFYFQNTTNPRIATHHPNFGDLEITVIEGVGKKNDDLHSIAKQLLAVAIENGNRISSLNNS